MSDKPATPEAAAVPPPKKGGIGIVGLLLPALLSAGASFGAVKVASKGAVVNEAHAAPSMKHEPRPPGPTVQLDPFIMSVRDGAQKPHPVKMTVAVEFELGTKEEATKAFTPRIRDAMLVHVRSLAFEDIVDPKRLEPLRSELLERCQKAGATAAEHVLITDLVAQ